MFTLVPIIHFLDGYKHYRFFDSTAHGFDSSLQLFFVLFTDSSERMMHTAPDVAAIYFSDRKSL